MSSDVVPPSTGKPSWLRAASVLLLLAATVLVALGVRLVEFETVNYWFDETFSLRMAEFPLPEMITRCTKDTHPPLFFLELKGWTSLFGNAEWPARMLSNLWSLAAVAVGFGLAYAAVRQDDASLHTHCKAIFAGTVAGLCLALSPIQISWAQQVRMYASLSCLAILSTWLLWRAVQQHGSLARWLIFGLVELAGLYTHVTFLFIFAGHILAGLAVVFQQRGDRAHVKSLLARAVPTMFVVGLLAVPWILVVRGQHSQVHDDFWVKPLDVELLGQAFVDSFTVRRGESPDSEIGLWIAQGLLVVLLVLAAGKRPSDLILSITTVSPFLLLIVVSLMDVNIVNGRYFIAGQALACVALGIVVTRLPFWVLRIPLAAGLLLALGLFARDHLEWRSEVADRDGLPNLLATWHEHRADGEPLIFSNPMFYTTARIDNGGSDGLKIFRSDDTYYPFFVGTAITSPEEYITPPELAAERWQTIWVCDYGNRTRYLQPVILGETWKLITESAFKDYSGTFYLRRYDRVPETSLAGRNPKPNPKTDNEPVPEQ